MRRSIATSRLVLRPPILSDADDLVEAIADPEVVRMMGSIPSNYSRAHADAFISRAQALSSDCTERLLAITQFDKIIGIIRVGPRDGHWFISYWLARSHWGHGLMSEAVPVMIDRFFKSCDESEIHADYFVDNHASARILKKIGFERVSMRHVHSVARDKNVQEICTRLDRDRLEELCQ